GEQQPDCLRRVGDLANRDEELVLPVADGAHEVPARQPHAVAAGDDEARVVALPLAHFGFPGASRAAVFLFVAHRFLLSSGTLWARRHGPDPWTGANPRFALRPDRRGSLF